MAYQLTRVNVWSTTEGAWWRRRQTNPQERVEWLLIFEPGFDLAHPDGGDDGIDAAVPDLYRDRFLYRGRPLQVAWLDVQAAEEQFAINEWERHV